MDRLDQLKVFAAVAARKSFSAAGRDLGLSPSGVSGAVHKLEARLKQRLFDRTTRAVALTPAGQTLLGHAHRILEEVAAAELTASLDSAAPRGLIRLSAPVGYGMERLGPVLARFLVRYPEVELKVHLADRVVDLIDEGFDIAVRVTQAIEPGLVARQVAAHSLVLCASPDYLARHGAPEKPSDLARHACLVYGERTPNTRWRFTGPGDVTSVVAVSGRYSANNGVLLAVAACEGLGITLAPDFLVAEDLASQRLREIMPTWRPPPLGVYAVRPAGRHPTPKVRCLVTHFAAELG